jgi:hypothetical protein
MTRRIASILGLLGALSASAVAQQQPGGRQPTKAEVHKVVQIINADKTKAAAYCKLTSLEDRMVEAFRSGEESRLVELGEQAENLERTLGAEYAKLKAGLIRVNLESKEGKELLSEFGVLDTMCFNNYCNLFERWKGRCHDGSRVRTLVKRLRALAPPA